MILNILFLMGLFFDLPISHEEKIDIQREYVQINQNIQEILKKHRVNAASIGVIKQGILHWQTQYGQQNETQSADQTTLINVGSITKTITAETVLKLVAQDKLDLDESMSAHWVDPDLVGNPMLDKLTPRMALNHTTGFPNWRFFTKDNKLVFRHEPGTTFGYSGEGVLYLTRFIEKKLGQSFEEIVKSEILAPLGMRDTFLVVDQKNFPRIAKPLDSKGNFHGFYCYPGGYCREEGSFSPTGDMVTTVSDYFRFLNATMQGRELPANIRKERFRIQGVEVRQEEIKCIDPNALCPNQMGYGLGWAISDFQGDKTIGHRGTDWSTVAVAYYYQESQDGLLIFLNAPNRQGIAAMVDLLRVLDPSSPELHGYIMRRDRSNE